MKLLLAYLSVYLSLVSSSITNDCHFYDNDFVHDDTFVNITDSPIKYIDLNVVIDTDLYKRWSSNTERNLRTILTETKRLHLKMKDVPGAKYYAHIEMLKWSVLDQTNDGSPYTSLTSFANWNKKQDKNYDANILFVGKRFLEKYNAGGIAFVGTICSIFGLSSAVVATPDDNFIISAQIAAHEIGHLLGMRHDDVIPPGFTSNCNNNRGIMGGIMGSNLNNYWSECSVAWLYEKFSVEGYNLLNPPCLEYSEIKQRPGKKHGKKHTHKRKHH